MCEAIFSYQGQKYLIQCNLSDTMKEIVQKFLTKSSLDKEKIYLLYNGTSLKEELTLEQTLSNEDKENNKMHILVETIDESGPDNDDKESGKNMVKSKNIICPKCQERAKIDFKNYKISLTCKNNDITNDIPFEEFDKTQLKDLSKIICNKCNTVTKADAFNNMFYRCTSCNSNLCPLCKSSHDKQHNIINYEQMEFICNTHNDTYTSFCNKCNINLCVICEKQHQDHDKLSFGNMMVEKEQLNERLNSLKNEIVEMDKNIKEMINMLNKVTNNMNNYTKFIEEIIKNYDVKNRNMEKVHNINKIYENIEKVIKELKKGVTGCSFNNSIKFKNLMELYNKMNVKEDYFICKIDKNKNIKLFGDTFLGHNKNVKIEVDGKEYPAQKEYNISDFGNKEILEFKIKGFENSTDLSYMFFKSPLLYLPNNISTWDLKNVTDISHMFSYCNLLSYLPDISNWNTEKVQKINDIFSGCSSLISLPDISKWNTNKVTNMDGIFQKCISLNSLPDISKWNTNNVESMNFMFADCSSLLSLPDISKWNTINLREISSIFHNCQSLINLPDISEWDTGNITNMSFLFNKCKSLSSLPNISKWKTEKVTSMLCMFYGCVSLSSLPDISKWNTSNVENMKYMFAECKSLKSLPDISIWKVKNVSNMSMMFKNCKNLSSIPPKISKWTPKEDKNKYIYNKMFFGCDEKKLNVSSKFMKSFDDKDLPYEYKDDSPYDVY